MKKKIVVLFVTVVFVFTGCAGRILYISSADSFKVADTYNSYTLTLDSAKPNIYFRDLSRITNDTFKRVAVIRPTDKDIKEVYRVFSGSKRMKILNDLQNKKPVVTDVDNNFKSRVIESYTVKSSSDKCRHIILKECSGLLMHIPDKGESLKVNLLVDAQGRFLSGDRGRLENNNYYNYRGIALTLNEEIQNIALEASKDLSSGSIVIMDVRTAEILACTVTPYSDYLNKALSQYSVGSVFKTVTAVTAIEYNVIRKYKCSGKIKVGDTVFTCQKGKAHGEQSLKDALANSCNCYFASLALELGAEKIINTAKRLGFDSYTELCNGWNIKNGILPDSSVNYSKGDTAQLGFGQGCLTATPLQICSLMCSIANGGVMKNPALVLGTVDDKMKLKRYDASKGRQVLSQSTADTILNYLRYVTEYGTGKTAYYKNQTAG